MFFDMDKYPEYLSVSIDLAPYGKVLVLSTPDSALLALGLQSLSIA